MDLEFEIPVAPAPTPASPAQDENTGTPEGGAAPESSPGSLVPDHEADQSGDIAPASGEASPPEDGKTVPPAEEKPDQKPRNAVEQRIARLVAEKREAERIAAEERAQRLKNEARQVVAQRMQMVTQQEPQPSAFETLHDYQRAHSDWATARAIEVFEANKYLAEVDAFATELPQQVQRRTAEEQFHQENAVLKEKLAPGLAKYPDLVEKLENPALPSARGTPLFDAVLACDHPADVAYTLASSPEKYAQLLQLSVQNPMLAFKVINKIDAKFAGSAPANQSSAPPPPPAVRPGSTPPKSEKSMTDAEWIEKREADLRKRKSR